MNREASELLKIAKEMLAMPMMTIRPDTQTVRWAKQSLMSALGVDSSWKQIYQEFMTVQEGGSNKFHYFGVFKDPTGFSRGGNAYGRIGYNPKAIMVAEGSTNSVLNAIQNKVMAKYSKGYNSIEV